MHFFRLLFTSLFIYKAKTLLFSTCLLSIGFATTLSLSEPIVKTTTTNSLFLKLLVLILLGLVVFAIIHNCRLNNILRKQMAKHHQITAELKKQSENNQALLLAAGDGIHVLNLKGELVLANEAFCQHLGYHSSQITKLHVADWDAQWTREELVNNIPDLRDTISTFETLHRKKDGSIISVEINTVGVEIDGEPLLFCSARDITQRKQQEMLLRQAASVFHHSHDGIILLDQQGRVLDANQSFTRLTGYTLPEILGRTPPLLNADCEMGSKEWDLAAHLDNTSIWTGETSNTGKSGKQYITRFTISKVPGDSEEQSTYIGVFTDITPLKQQQAQLEKMIHYDNLTQLPNRVLLMDRLNQAMLNAKRDNSLVAVLYIDLDGFKPINDTFGHALGDTFLCHIGKAMSAAIRGKDTLARIGGDEFVAILSGFDSSTAADPMISRILAAATTPMLYQEQSLQVSASIGVSLFPWHAENAETLLQKADAAMYHAKKSGKDRYHYHGNS